MHSGCWGLTGTTRFSSSPFACSGVVAVAAYWIAGRASGREWVAVWTGVVFACYFSEMLVTTTYAIASEPLFAALLSLDMVLFVRSVDRQSVSGAAAAGALLALAALSQPTVILLPVVSIGWMLLRLRTGRHCDEHRLLRGIWSPAAAVGGPTTIAFFGEPSSRRR